MKKTVIVILACLIVTGTAFAQADSLNMRFEGSWEAPGGLQSVFVQDSYAYAIDGQSLWIIDVSNPSNPVDVGCYKDTSGPAFSVHVQDQYAYVGYGWGLHVVDVSIPSEPQEVGHCEGFAFHEVYVVGDYAYVVDDYENFFIIDVSDPTDPKQVGAYNLSFPTDVHVKDSYAYVAEGEYEPVLKVVDVSDPSNPEQVGFWDSGHGSGWGVSACVFVLGNYAYMCCFLAEPLGGAGELFVLDISTPSNPKEVDSLIGTYISSEVFVSDSYAYFGRDDGLRVIDVSDPTDLREVGYYDYDTSSICLWDGPTHVLGPYVYVASSGELCIYENLLWEGVEEEPTPTASPIQLSTTLNHLSYNLPGQAQLTLYSADGRKVCEETVEGKGIWEAPAELSRGVYFARVVTENHSARSKVVVVR